MFKPDNRVMSLASSGVGGFDEEATVEAEYTVRITERMGCVTATAFYSS